jgi:hypothetical protein
MARKLRTYFRYAKKIIILLLFGITFLPSSSCTKKKNEPLQLNVKWNINIDGTQNSWQGVYYINPFTLNEISFESEEEGKCIQQSGGGRYIVVMEKKWTSSPSNNSINLGFRCSINDTIGSVNLTTSNYTYEYSHFNINTKNGNYLSSLPNSNITLNITEVNTDDNGLGVVKGNFSGVIGKQTGGTANISGYFEAFTRSK